MFYRNKENWVFSKSIYHDLKCLQYGAVQGVMYDVFFSLGTLVISF